MRTRGGGAEGEGEDDFPLSRGSILDSEIMT